MVPGWSRLSVARQLLVLQLAVTAVVVLCAGGLAYLDARRDSDTLARAEVVALAEGLAAEPVVADALRSADPAAQLQPLAESVRVATDVDFVVIMGPDRVRYSHPNPSLIGGTFIGRVGDPGTRSTYVERSTGTLGPSVRAVAAVRSGDVPIGYVAVGLTERRIADQLRDELPVVAAVAVLALLLSGLGAYLVSRRLHRLTRGVGPAEITRLFEHHDAVLRAVREGLVVVDDRSRVVLLNHGAVRLLGLQGEPARYEGTPVGELDLPDSLSRLLHEGRTATDELHLTRAAVVVVSTTAVERDGRRLGTVTTLRDESDLHAVTSELDSVRGFADALRAQAHESANRLHTVITLIELDRADEAVEFATAELASAQRLTDRVLAAVDEPVVAALLLGKAAQAHERGVELVIDEGTSLTGSRVPPTDLVTVVGNLVDNAVDAVVAGPPPRRVDVLLRCDDGGVLVRVADSGPGIPADRVEDAFRRGWSTKPGGALHGRGLGLALVAAAVERHGGTISVTPAPDAAVEVRFPALERSGA
ncbi:MAG: ATP-binding protein [Actinomycetes bacterium]